MNNFEERERQLKQFVLDRRWQSICPSAYRDTDESQLKDECKNVIASYGKGEQYVFHEFLEKLLLWECGSKGLLIAGPSRTGKTRCTYLLLRKLLYTIFRDARRAASGEIAEPIVALSSNQFGHECIERFKDGSVVQWLNKLYKKPLVFIDDFGKEPFTPRVEAELFGVIEARTANSLPIILTTNFNKENLCKRFSTPDSGSPVIERLTEFCDNIVLTEVLGGE